MLSWYWMVSWAFSIISLPVYTELPVLKRLPGLTFPFVWSTLHSSAGAPCSTIPLGCVLCFVPMCTSSVLAYCAGVSPVLAHRAPLSPTLQPDRPTNRRQKHAVTGRVIWFSIDFLENFLRNKVLNQMGEYSFKSSTYVCCLILCALKCFVIGKMVL